MSEPTSANETVPTLDGRADPLCPNGCLKTKPMRWIEDSFYCPLCEDEWPPDLAGSDT